MRTEIGKKTIELLGIPGAMLDADKLSYRKAHPGNAVVFNANVCTIEGKIWWGDLDVSKNLENLQTLATDIGKPVYVLREMDGRFEHEENPLLHKAIVMVNPRQ
jgi:hypothetical protein